MRRRRTTHLRRLFLCLWLGFVSAVSAQELGRRTGFVTAVMDGNHIKVQLDSGPVLVRLANIDAPDGKQPGGRQARAALDLRILGERVLLDVLALDEQESHVAVVYFGEENINAWMVKQGHAWAHRETAKERDYCVWENAARSLRRGLWAGKEWVAPWEWREWQRDRKGFLTDYTHASTASCIAEIARNP